MRCQYQSLPAVTNFCQCLPQHLSCYRIHTSSWFIQEHNWRVSHQSNGCAQLALVATTNKPISDLLSNGLPTNMTTDALVQLQPGDSSVFRKKYGSLKPDLHISHWTSPVSHPLAVVAFYFSSSLPEAILQQEITVTER